ncbi:hypothetical protein C1I98_05805, partial [Spongiactinospora gelatinilytica]
TTTIAVGTRPTAMVVVMIVGQPMLKEPVNLAFLRPPARPNVARRTSRAKDLLRLSATSS